MQADSDMQQVNDSDKYYGNLIRVTLSPPQFPSILAKREQTILILLFVDSLRNEHIACATESAPARLCSKNCTNVISDKSQSMTNCLPESNKSHLIKPTTTDGLSQLNLDPGKGLSTEF